MGSAGMGAWFYDPATVVVFADERMDRIFESPEPNGVVIHWLDLLQLGPTRPIAARCATGCLSASRFADCPVTQLAGWGSRNPSGTIQPFNRSSPMICSEIIDNWGSEQVHTVGSSHRNGKRWTAGQGLPWCPFARWRLISTHSFSRCCWTSSRTCSLCNKAGLRVFSLLFNARSSFTRSSFTWHWFPDVIWTSTNVIRRMIDSIRLENTLLAAFPEEIGESMHGRRPRLGGNGSSI
jgi:hypothetical protein